MGTSPLIELHDIGREFDSGGESLWALKQASLTIHAGEMVAIIGASGSGKSTLLNILGCLDRASCGTYKISGKDVESLDDDELAKLRRDRFGFIFQRYNLLKHLTAQDNVEVPALYAGVPLEKRHEHSQALLSRLGLGQRMDHRPNQLSGGQQQRVSIARALMNGGDIILADEPTGALDKKSGEDFMVILHELHRQGHTIIIVTHDSNVAAHAQRIIEVSDGRIVRDAPNPNPVSEAEQIYLPKGTLPVQNMKSWLRSEAQKLTEGVKIALSALKTSKLRSVLTLLGIVIGIASVVLIVALSQATEELAFNQLKSSAATSLTIKRGKGYDDDYADSIQTLNDADIVALQKIPGIIRVVPLIEQNMRIRYQRESVNGYIVGATADMWQTLNVKMVAGRWVSHWDISQKSAVTVLNKRTAEKLGTSPKQLIGKSILIGQLPSTIVGVIGEPGGVDLGLAETYGYRAWLPYTTVNNRMLGQAYYSSLSVTFNQSTSPAVIQSAVTKTLSILHGKVDFFIESNEAMWKNLQDMVAKISLGLSGIAAISLLVGGIGVMNIMLVSVSERTQEIGIRMAIGARQRDIQWQFLIESVTLCIVGGMIAILFCIAVTSAISYFTELITLKISPKVMMAAFATASLIGIVFGFFPAKRAAKLNPVAALSKE